jgi:hypothetical protein
MTEYWTCNIVKHFYLFGLLLYGDLLYKILLRLLCKVTQYQMKWTHTVYASKPVPNEMDTHSLRQ